MSMSSCVRSCAARVDRIGVVVPARDEAKLVARCLHALDAAARRVTAPVVICAVVDDCADATSEIVEDALVELGTSLRICSINARSVGVARGVGMADLLDHLGAEGTWLATTDADSVVPPDWLRGQLRHVQAGANVVIGTVAVADWSPWPDRVRSAAQRAYLEEFGPDGHGHIHGANLGMWAASYLRAGGFPPVTANEDILLVRALVAVHEPVTWAQDVTVTTSGRRSGRAPAGFADFLGKLEVQEPPSAVCA